MQWRVESVQCTVTIILFYLIFNQFRLALTRLELEYLTYPQADAMEEEPLLDVHSANTLNEHT